MWISISFFNPVEPEKGSKMTSRSSGYSKVLVGLAIGYALAMFVGGSAVHYKNILKYTERNYMRGRKNERKLKRYGERLSKHELELQEMSKNILKLQGFGR